MLIKFNSGVTLNVTDNTYELTFPNGNCVEFDAAGNRKPQTNELLAHVKLGDYIESIPDADFIVLSSDETGCYNDQKLNVKKATLWKVLKIDGNNVYAISAKSVGDLVLGGMAGYENSAAVLTRIAHACTNRISSSTYPGYGPTSRKNVHFDSITEVYERPPYSDEPDSYKEDVELISAMKIASDKGIWLASRSLDIYQGNYYFYVNSIDRTGEVGRQYLQKSYIAGNLYADGARKEVFPILIFPAHSKVKSGDGTEDNPYILE